MRSPARRRRSRAISQSVKRASGIVSATKISGRREVGRVVEGARDLDLRLPERLDEPEQRDERRVLLQPDEVVQERWDDAAHRLRERRRSVSAWPRGQAERARRRLLARDAPTRSRLGRPRRRRPSRRARARRSPRRTRDVGTPASCEAGHAEAEQEDDEDRRHAAEEVGVGVARAGAAGRRRARAGCAARRAASAKTRMNASASRKIFTFSRNGSRMSGNDSRNSGQSKNALCTSSQPGELTTASASAPKTTIVLAARSRGCGRRPALRGCGSRGSASSSDGGAPSPRRATAAGFRFERPVVLQRRERLVDAVAERVALLEHHPEVLLAALRRGTGRRSCRSSPAGPTTKNAVGRSTTIPSICCRSAPRRRRSTCRRRAAPAVGWIVVADVLEARRPDLGAELVLGEVVHARSRR